MPLQPFLDTMFFPPSLTAIPAGLVATFSGWQPSQKAPRKFRFILIQPPGFSCGIAMILDHKDNDHLVEYPSH